MISYKNDSTLRKLKFRQLSADGINSEKTDLLIVSRKIRACSEVIEKADGDIFPAAFAWYGMVTPRRIHRTKP